MTKVNPSVLVWARETAGLNIEEACDKLGIKDTKGTSATEQLRNLETGEKEPTRTMLENMGKKYHRPLIIFYMPTIPNRGNRGQDFRTLPHDFSQATNAIVDTLIRDIQVRQSIIRSALEDEEEINPLTFINSHRISDGPTVITQTVKQLLHFNLSDFRTKTDASEAFSFLRTKIESIGVFIILISDLGNYRTEIGLEYFRGFSISDDIAPFIVINDKDAKSAWSFTLIHELVHLLLGQTGVSGQNSDMDIEQFCNDIASDLLFPLEELVMFNKTITNNFEQLKNKISTFAKSRNISSSMVAYKLYRSNIIDKQTWSELNSIYKSYWDKAREDQKTKAKTKGGGPDYYIVHRAHIGKSLINLVQRMLVSGSLSSTKAGKVLGVNAKNVHKMFGFNNSQIRH